MRNAITYGQNYSHFASATMIFVVAVCAFVLPVFAHSAPAVPDTLAQSSPAKAHDSIATVLLALNPEAPAEKSLTMPPAVHGDTLAIVLPDPKPFDDYDIWIPTETEFNPDPTRAVWMSALLPGMGQIYNRRYWKLPIIVGGYLALAYATTWNNGMLTDYTRAYRDISDNDPNTKSYMNFFPPTVKEEDLDHQWLTNILRSRKNFYRRNRDLCIIGMVGVYLLAMVDAYVDASLSHFDITPDLSINWAPAIMQDSRSRGPSLGLQCAFTF